MNLFYQKSQSKNIILAASFNTFKTLQNFHYFAIHKHKNPKHRQIETWTCNILCMKRTSIEYLKLLGNLLKTSQKLLPFVYFSVFSVFSLFRIKYQILQKFFKNFKDATRTMLQNCAICAEILRYVCLYICWTGNFVSHKANHAKLIGYLWLANRFWLQNYVGPAIIQELCFALLSERCGLVSETGLCVVLW